MKKVIIGLALLTSIFAFANTVGASSFEAKEINTYADGSMYIYQPVVLLNGNYVPISAVSDVRGVCKAFGFENEVGFAGTQLQNLVKSMSAEITSDGIANLRFTENGYLIESILCI